MPAPFPDAKPPTSPRPRFCLPLVLARWLVAAGCIAFSVQWLAQASAQENRATTTVEPTDPASDSLPLTDSSGRLTPTPAAPSVVESNEAAARRAHRGAMLVGSLTVFMLAVFVGFEIITKVPPTLHTPLMSGSNAISGITVVGAIIIAGNSLGGFGSFLGLIAVILATINVVGGFLVTHRMLMMFKKR